MGATAEQITEVRRMVDEPTTTTYSDTLITSFIERYPMIDELGTDPYYWTQTGSVPTKTYNTDWVPTYNLHAAAADIWGEKAAKLSAMFDFSADGGNYQRSQAYQQAVTMARYHAMKSGIKTIKQIKVPDEPGSLANRPSWIGNLPEVRD